MKLESGMIDEIVRRVTAAAQVDRIVLFGSTAAGEATRDTDVDLLILESAPLNRREEAVRIGGALRGMDLDFDVVVLSTNEFERRKHTVGGIEYPAHRYGKVLFARA
jgi:predicted nucleotidyltransferase